MKEALVVLLHWHICFFIKYCGVGSKSGTIEMASSSSPTDQQQLRDEDREEEHPPLQPVKECVHKTKTIQFLGRTTPIVLQNDNGPCPLLAICQCISHLRVSSFRIFYCSFAWFLRWYRFLYCLSSTKLDCVSNMEFPFLHDCLLLSIPLPLFIVFILFIMLVLDWFFKLMTWTMFCYVLILMVFRYFYMFLFTPHRTICLYFSFLWEIYQSKWFLDRCQFLQYPRLSFLLYLIAYHKQTETRQGSYFLIFGFSCNLPTKTY